MSAALPAPPPPDASSEPPAREGAHLAAFRFRFGPETAAPSFGPVTRPAPGERWTLAQTLQEVRLRPLALVATSRGVHCRRRGFGSDAALDDALARFAGPLRVWLRLGGHADAPVPWTARGWDDATRLYAAWFGLLFQPPGEPVELRPGERVADWEQFRASVAGRLQAGPAATSAERVAADLAALYARFGGEAERVRVPDHRPSIAA